MAPSQSYRETLSSIHQTKLHFDETILTPTIRDVPTKEFVVYRHLIHRLHFLPFGCMAGVFGKRDLDDGVARVWSGLAYG